jgi:hypothetical protein
VRNGNEGRKHRTERGNTDEEWKRKHTMMNKK